MHSQITHALTRLRKTKFNMRKYIFSQKQVYIYLGHQERHHGNRRVWSGAAPPESNQGDTKILKRGARKTRKGHSVWADRQGLPVCVDCAGDLVGFSQRLYADFRGAGKP